MSDEERAARERRARAKINLLVLRQIAVIFPSYDAMQGPEAQALWMETWRDLMQTSIEAMVTAEVEGVEL